MSEEAAASLEHVNFTVPDSRATAQMMCDLFGWRIRWEGAALGNGHTVHVGDDKRYLALYSPAGEPGSARVNKTRTGHMNHVGIVVDDLDAVEERIKAKGYQTHSHADYEPGKRFYFDDENGIEFEVVSYA